MLWNVCTTAGRETVLGAMLLLLVCSFSKTLRAQDSLPTRQTSTVLKPGDLVCPGGFPTDLTVMNCSYTEDLRLKQWVTSSISDQAMLGAAVYGLGAQIIQSPSEWKRTWEGYGDRIGVRYTQAAARGTAEFLVGNLLHDDPRHRSYKDAPLTHYGTKITSCNANGFVITTYPPPSHLVWRRIGHAFVDSVTVLRSNPCGIGARMPAIDRMVGIAASAYAGYAWYPRSENTIDKVAQRAAGAYGSTLAGSFYTEFSPEISIGLSWIAKHL